MHKYALIFLSTGLLASCGTGSRAPDAPNKEQPTASAPAPQPAPAASRPKAERPVVAERKPLDEAQKAAEVVQRYYALIEEGRYADAWRLRWDSDDDPGNRAKAFINSFAQYRGYHATVGAPSEVEGAAGSLYAEISVQLYGEYKDGRPFATAGTVTARRVNDVPGSTDAQRSWRVYSN